MCGGGALARLGAFSRRIGDFVRSIASLDEDAPVWSHPESERAGRPLIVLLHGYGGHESDWTAWFPALPAGTVGVALRGPVAVEQRWAWADVVTKARGVTALPRRLVVCSRGWTARTLSASRWSAGRKAVRSGCTCSGSGRNGSSPWRSSPGSSRISGRTPGYVPDVHPSGTAWGDVRTSFRRIWPRRHGAGSRSTRPLVCRFPGRDPYVVARLRRWRAEVHRRGAGGGSFPVAAMKGRR